MDLASGADIPVTPAVGGCHTQIEVQTDTAVERLFAGWAHRDGIEITVRVPSIVFTFIRKDNLIARRLHLVNQGEHRHSHDVEHQASDRHPIVSIAKADTALIDLHQGHIARILDEVEVLRTVVVEFLVVVHQAGDE